MTVNVIGQWYCTKLAVEHMGKTGGGAIVNNASISGVMAFPGAVDYAASKHALVGMTKGHALECAGRNVRINCICPGFFKTDMFAENFAEAEAHLSENVIPAGRIADPEEVSKLVYWLLVDGTYCYGASIVIDGGIMAGPKPQAG
jgi:NAD(P)-dependent dehydrogenase (short-subunit alcohol dehydrogenase family)